VNRTLQMLLRYVVDSLNCMADDGIPSTIKATLKQKRSVSAAWRQKGIMSQK